LNRWLSSLEGALVMRLSVILLGAVIVLAAAVGFEAYFATAEVGDEALAHAFLEEFLSDVLWLAPVIGALVLGVTVWTIRHGLRPLKRASSQAAQITPSNFGVRLDTNGLPLEILPLATAVNDALARLERGFEVQRQFTARAAHELRTPLAILHAGLENLGDVPDAEKLRADSRRMNRLVEQLLHVARLDVMPLDVTTEVDLNKIARDLVEYLAPWAVAQRRALALEASPEPVVVRGNEHAIGDALRNLIENAVTYAPQDTEVTVAVTHGGALSVTDHGPGIAPDDRPKMFERFWRGSTAPLYASGAGLGLAIVADIVRAHGATIEVSDVSEGGTKFMICFPSP
jgi:signal transduction histidine kinase